MTAGKGRLPFGPSIDRIDPSRGYEPDNCRLVVWRFNSLRGDAHHPEWDRACRDQVLREWGAMLDALT